MVFWSFFFFCFLGFSHVANSSDSVVKFNFMSLLAFAQNIKLNVSIIIWRNVTMQAGLQDLTSTKQSLVDVFESNKKLNF